jgi:hypothetical protein
VLTAEFNSLWRSPRLPALDGVVHVFESAHMWRHVETPTDPFAVIDHPLVQIPVLRMAPPSSHRRIVRGLLR